MVEQFNSNGGTPGDLYRFSGPDNTNGQGQARPNNNNPDLYQWSGQGGQNPRTRQGGDQNVSGTGNDQSDASHDPFAGERMGMRGNEKPYRTQIYYSADGSTEYINNFYKRANVIENAPADGQDYRTNPNMDFRKHICHCRDQQTMRDGNYQNQVNQYVPGEGARGLTDPWILAQQGQQSPQGRAIAEQRNRLQARQQVLDGAYRQACRDYMNHEPIDSHNYYSKYINPNLAGPRPQDYQKNNGIYSNNGSGNSNYGDGNLALNGQYGNGNTGNGYFADQSSPNGYFADRNPNANANLNDNLNGGTYDNLNGGTYDNLNSGTYDNGYYNDGLVPNYSQNYQTYPVYSQRGPRHGGVYFPVGGIASGGNPALQIAEGTGIGLSAQLMLQQLRRQHHR